MDWFLYDNGLRHERVNLQIFSRNNPQLDKLLENFNSIVIGQSITNIFRNIKTKF